MSDRMWVSNSSIESWNWPGAPNTAELPGRCLALQASQMAHSVWALCAIERKWWQFWLPQERERWVNVALRDSDTRRMAETEGLGSKTE